MCKWCEQPEDGGLDFKVDTVELGALGKLEVTSGLWNFNYDGKGNPFLLFDVWFTDIGGYGGQDMCEQKMYIDYCPFCGKRLTEDRGLPDAD